MATWQLRLISAAAMIDAIGEAGVNLVTTKMEIRLTWMAHRPAADPVIQIEKAGLFRNFGAGAGRDQAAGWRRRNGCLLIAGALPEESARSNRDDSRHRLGGRGISARLSSNLAWLWRGGDSTGCRRWGGRRGRTGRHGHLRLWRRGRCRLCDLWCCCNGRSIGLVVGFHR